MDGFMSLVSSQEVAGLKIKEWNIIQFSKLSGILAAIAKEYQAKNISFDALSGALASADGQGVNLAALSTNVLEIIEPFTRHATMILQVSCGVDTKKLEEISYTDGLVVLILILKTNLDHMTGFFGRLAAQPTEAIAATGSTAS